MEDVSLGVKNQNVHFRKKDAGKGDGREERVVHCEDEFLYVCSAFGEPRGQHCEDAVDQSCQGAKENVAQTVGGIGDISCQVRLVCADEQQSPVETKFQYGEHVF